MKTCANCSRETKVFLVDLNSFDPNGKKIRFKRCKRKIPLQKKKKKKKKKKKRFLCDINFGQNLYQDEW